MVLSLLFEGRFDDYMAAARQDAQLWLFVHVPKTAGSSLGGELAALAPPYCNIHIDHRDRSRPAPARFDTAVDAFLARHAERPFHSASGHLHNAHMQRICAAIPGARPITMLREPMSRIVSDYRYQRSPMHPLHEEVAKRTPDLRSFIDLPGQRNRTAKHLAPADLIRRGDVQACVDYVLAHFTFVGVQEDYDLHLGALTTLIGGRPKAPKERKRVNTEVEAVEVSPAEAAKAAALNAIDFAIYDTVTARLAEVREPLRAWLATQA